MKLKAVLLLATLPGLMACVPDPSAYESAPVRIETPEGIVTCQLYTKDIVAWDRAIDRPAAMSVKAADDYCHAEGLRQKNG